MRILHVTPYYTPAYAFGGVVRSVEGMTLALARRGHDVTVLTTDALDQQRRFTGAQDEFIDGLQIHRVRNLSPRLRGRANLSTPFYMGAVAQGLLPHVDIVHYHEFRTAENMLVTPLARRFNKPMVLSPHGTLNRNTGRGGLKAGWDRILSPMVARRFDHVVGLTEAEVEEVQELWNIFHAQSEFSIVPNGVNPKDYEHLTGREIFRERYGLRDATVCLFMGRLHERKGIRVLVEAFKAANVPNTKLLIAGPDEGMRAALESLIDERIVLTGYLAGDDRLAALAGADMLALPAVGEGLPMVVLEAMAAGLPVIVSPECHLPEVAKWGAGIEVEQNIESVREALHHLFTHPTLRRSMGAAAQRLVRERFTWDAVAEQLEAIYSTLTQSA